MALPVDVDAVEQMRNVIMQVHVKRWRELRFRTWLGVNLIRLACLVMNCDIQIVDVDGDA